MSCRAKLRSADFGLGSVEPGPRAERIVRLPRDEFRLAVCDDRWATDRLEVRHPVASSSMQCARTSFLVRASCAASKQNPRTAGWAPGVEMAYPRRKLRTVFPAQAGIPSKQ